MTPTFETDTPAGENPVRPTSAQTFDQGWRRVLGVPSLVLLGLVYMVPLTIFSTWVIHNLVLPGIGFALTAWLWTSLSGWSFTFGLAWAGVGLIYLAFLTRGFRKPAPQLELEEA